ncbi:MAG TPA: SIR2 family protein [Paraburkholderia sp.]|uniref:SIR2 family protein n=1 Tax=Paraburkholderia sp. TaxID=1926495 RepID=UPI002B48C800|nr:SIR2 family protein [Paraburkholderia sp.]HKR40221.1 SIR2 family protein [Paraburkholderia sp.]
MDEYSQVDTWKTKSKVLNLLARSARDNRLVLVLGAGASMKCGLPDWTSLIENAHEIANFTRKPRISDNLAVENLAASMTQPEFVAVMKRALYSVRDASTKKLRSFVESDAPRSGLLEAICAVVMLSCRRGHGTLVTYNFDDLVEAYLVRRGLFAYPYSQQPDWFHNEDVAVLHPHGFLSRRNDFKSSESITISALDFDKQTGNITDLWRTRLVTLYQSHTPLFIGLSGNDQNLSSVLQTVKDSHVSRATSRKFWGVRLCTKDDNTIDFWEHRGVWCETFDSFDDLPAYLMSVCERSADMLIRAKLKP